MRGFWYVLEAIIAGTILISFLIILGRALMAAPADVSVNEKPFNVLEGLDNRGLLRNYTMAGDAEGLNSEVSIFSYNHSVQICNASGNCSGTPPAAGTVWTGSYLVAGDGNYTPREVKLYLWND
jgi:hypothetical protein